MSSESVVSAMIYSLVGSAGRSGVPLSYLSEDYEKQYGQPLPIHKFGLTDLAEYIECHPKLLMLDKSAAISLDLIKEDTFGEHEVPMGSMIVYPKKFVLAAQTANLSASFWEGEDNLQRIFESEPEPGDTRKVGKQKAITRPGGISMAGTGERSADTSVDNDRPPTVDELRAAGLDVAAVDYIAADGHLSPGAVDAHMERVRAVVAQEADRLAAAASAAAGAPTVVKASRMRHTRKASMDGDSGAMPAAQSAAAAAAVIARQSASASATESTDTLVATAATQSSADEQGEEEDAFVRHIRSFASEGMEEYVRHSFVHDAMKQAGGCVQLDALYEYYKMYEDIAAPECPLDKSAFKAIAAEVAAGRPETYELIVPSNKDYAPTGIRNRANDCT